MAKKKQTTNTNSASADSQLHLTVIALVALVAIVAMVALFMQGSEAELSTGSELVAADGGYPSTAASKNLHGLPVVEVEQGP